MVALLAILRALRRVVGRDLGTLASVKVNNLFLFVALLVYGALNSGQRPKSADPFFALLGFLLLFPLSSDPLAKLPASRRALWPLTQTQRLALRLASLALSPVFWIAVLILFRTAQLRLALALLAFALAIQTAAAFRGRGRLRVSVFPGRRAGLFRKDLRQMLSVLDPYAALLLSLGGGIYRFFGHHPDPYAYSIIGLLVALSLSTYAQSLFGLDFDSGITRYRLLPLRGWRILLSKGVAFLAVLVLLLLPLDAAPGLTFGLAALAIGHYSSIFLHLPQQRWRFTGGRLLPAGALQAIGGMALGFAEMQHGPTILAAAALGYVLSLYYYGACWERRVSDAR